MSTSVVGQTKPVDNGRAPESRSTGRSRRRATGQTNPILRLLVLSALTIVFTYPFVWMVLSSLKTPETFFTAFFALPETLNFQNYAEAWSSGMAGYLFNSIVVTSGTVALVLVLCLPLAYALARLQFPGRRVIFAGFLIVLFVPMPLAIIPLYELVAKLGLINTYAAMILPYAAGALPFAVVFTTAYFRTLPLELDEAATLDGANPGQAFFHVALPLARPAIATVVILTFFGAWNELLVALTLTQSASVRTIPVGLLSFSPAYGVADFPQMFAALTIATLPVFIVFVIFQRQFIAGLVQGVFK